MLKSCQRLLTITLLAVPALLSLACGSNAEQRRCRSAVALKDGLGLSAGTWETGTAVRPKAIETRESIDPIPSNCSGPIDSRTVGEPAYETSTATADSMKTSSAPVGSDPVDTGGSAVPGYGRPDPGQPMTAGLLTAGSFDDAMNFEIFKKYWNQPVSNGMSWESINNEQVQWASIADLTPPKRFAGSRPTALDLSLIIDVTGSMGDELDYIKRELKNIVDTIHQRYPDVKQRFSLIVYKDQGDEFITRGHPFTEDLSSFQSFLDQQSAGGGGDYPEALDTALSEANSKLQWGDAQTAKLSFLIADAPAHDNKLAETFNSLLQLKDKGVHLYPVAASGAADAAERIMRYGALVTGGEYLFLSDDSRIGNAHAEPHIPCYYIRKLNEIMIATISAELEQKRRDPLPSEVIRTVGTPLMGACQ